MLRIFLTLHLLFFSWIATAEMKINFCGDKPIFGRIEKVGLVEKRITLDAKLDTGAAMTSLSATSITIINNDGKSWVRFSTILPNETINWVKPLIGYARILMRSEEYEKNSTPVYSRRPVIMLQICMGHHEEKVLVNLVDRTHFRYPMLLGSNALKKYKGVIDVAEQYLTLPTCE
jgi:hypothetical protein